MIYVWGQSKTNKSLQWYLRCVTGRDDTADQFNIALIYIYGKGNLSQNSQQAYHWFMKAAENDHKEAPNPLGCMYGLELGVDQEYDLALQ